LEHVLSIIIWDNLMNQVLQLLYHSSVIYRLKYGIFIGIVHTTWYE